MSALAILIATAIGIVIGLFLGALLAANHQIDAESDEHEEFPGC